MMMLPKFIQRFSTGNYLLDGIENGRQHLLVKVAFSINTTKILAEILGRHRYIETLGIMIVLIHVQHDYSIS